MKTNSKLPLVILVHLEDVAEVGVLFISQILEYMNVLVISSLLNPSLSPFILLPVLAAKMSSQALKECLKVFLDSRDRCSYCLQPLSKNPS